MAMNKKKKDPRITVLCVILAVILSAYSARLMDWQIFNRDKYVNESLATSATYTSIKAARGEILDCYGRTFASNKEAYNLVLNKIYLPDDKLNDTILTLTRLLTKTGEKWVDNAPISAKAPFVFEEVGNISPATMISELGLAHYATMENCWDVMVEKFELEGYTQKQTRTIMGIRLTMLVADYADTIPYTFAQGVSLDTVTKIEEASEQLPGVEVSVVTTRNYVADVIAPHIIGNIGPIYSEEWDELKEKGYTYSDYVGKSGIEKYAEDYLRGTDGELKTIRDANGNVISTKVTIEPEAGNSVMLTLDRNIQTVAQNSLKELIDQLSSSDDPNTSSANAGSIVVMNVNTGAVLAAVTYPSYSINTYKSEYDSLLNNPARPLFNRAFSGIYAPGSTFKPATASIALQNGNVKKGENIYCSQIYDYYEDYQPSCMHFHGALDVIGALQVSCNYFFYESGRRVGITKLNEYCKKYGLGVETGLELNEATGVLAGRTYRESINSYWTDGDTLQAAIGQSDNAFTPLQLAVYISTLANGGTRYRAHLIDEIRNYDLTQILEQTKPEVLDTTGISQSVYDVVKKGMLSVTTEGSVSSIFADYPIQVGGKTGTATVYDNGKEYDNGVFVAFAPYEKPEIAVVTVVEKGGYGSGCAQPAHDIFDAYFFYGGKPYTGQQTGVLIS
jgi:penicillin-binding protein 2